VVKISAVFSEIIGGKSQFWPIIPTVAICQLKISGFTGLNVTKFVHNIEKSLPFNIFKQEAQLKQGLADRTAKTAVSVAI